MKLAIIADSHDNLVNLDRALAICGDADTLIHCGDVSSEETLRHLAAGFSRAIHVVAGNTDWGWDDHLPDNVVHHGDEGDITWQGVAIAFCHHPEPARRLAVSGKYDFVFYGHTHRPWIERLGQCVLANPGTLSGMFAKPTLAVYDSVSKKLELLPLYP